MPSQANGQRIVIFRPGQFGDTLTAFPVIEGLASLFPERAIIYCTNRFRQGDFVLGEQVAQLSPWLAQVATYCVEDGARSRWRDLKGQLQVQRQDTLVYLPYAPATPMQVARDWLFFRTLGFRRMVGFPFFWRWARQWPRLIPPLPQETERLLAGLNASGLPVKAPSRCVIKADEAWGQRQWRLWGLAGRQVLAMCPGSKMQSKRWPLERFMAVGREWHRRTGSAVVVVGGPEEADMAETLVQEWDGYGFSACGASIPQTAAVLTRSRVYCGNDTGSMHLAALLGIPCVALFSSRDRPALWFPYGPGHVVLRRQVSCEYCRLENCFANPSPCLEKTSVNEVLEALERLWPPAP
jgi:heptosyltransferase III